MPRGSCRLILPVLIVCFLPLADGCGRTPARTKPQETTPTLVERTTTRPSTLYTRPPPGSKLQCTEEERRDSGCLNGGSCFAIEFFDSRSAHCQCSDIWTGTRCEEFDDSVFVLSADKVEKAGIAAGVVVLIIIVTVVIVYLVIKKRKQRKERAQINGSANGHAGKSLVCGEKPNFESEDGEKCTDV